MRSAAHGVSSKNRSSLAIRNSTLACSASVSSTPRCIGSASSEVRVWVQRRPHGRPVHGDARGSSRSSNSSSSSSSSNRSNRSGRRQHWLAAGMARRSRHAAHASGRMQKLDACRPPRPRNARRHAPPAPLARPPRSAAHMARAQSVGLRRSTEERQPPRAARPMEALPGSQRRMPTRRLGSWPSLLGLVARHASVACSGSRSSGSAARRSAWV